MKSKKTKWTKASEIKRNWYILDATDQILGRFCVEVAKLLIGKTKTNYVPNVDCGDFVVVINSEKIKLTRGKEQKKMYYKHSGHMGGLRELTFDQMMKKDANEVIELAVKRMLPDTKLRSSMMNRLYIYKDANHKQEAQKPIEYKL